MFIPIIIFSLAALILSSIIIAVSFHVTRYRYHNDASLFVFSVICILYILMTVMTFVLFRYSEVTNQPTIIKSTKSENL